MSVWRMRAGRVSQAYALRAWRLFPIFKHRICLCNLRQGCAASTMFAPLLSACHYPAEGQLLKLPANKFTVREREMLIGSGILPPEFFAATKNPFVIGAGAREQSQSHFCFVQTMTQHGERTATSRSCQK
jgi:hypothetical protein